MAHLTPDQLKVLLRSDPLDQIAREHVFGGDPYCFRKKPNDYQQMKELLANGIGLHVEAITIVGSAKVGFSLDPKNPFLPFTPEKDIDVVVVDSDLFDEFWSHLMSWSYPLLGRVPANDWRWFSTHKDDVFWGYVYPGLKLPRYPALPQLIKPIHEFYTRWQTAFLGLGRYRAFAGPTITGRLYRTWDHALAYHVEGLRLIATELTEK